MLAAVVIVGLLTGCGDDDNSPAGPDGEAPPETSLLASKLAVLSIAVATGPEGRSFFDNFLACPRRGVVNYHNTIAGRRATFSGCDVGDGVTVDGTAELRWVGANLSSDRSQLTRLELSGPLTVRGEGGGAADVDAMRVEGIAFRAPSPSDDEPAVNRLLIESLRVTVLGTTVAVDDRGTPERLFQPTLDLNTLPNPTNSLAVLTEADVKRVAYDAAMTLASILFDELIEIQRGPHTHTNPCGTLRVTPDAARTTTRLEYAWTGCPLPGGLVLEGTFTQDVAPGTDLRTALAMVVTGQLTIGGGVPRTTLTRLEWAIGGLGSLPANATIRGTLVAAGGQQRPFAFTLTVDD
jgi:hypothetical protein